MKTFFPSLAMALLLALPAQRGLADTDPLPSWNDGAAKASITRFVEKTTTPGSADFIEPKDRIAVFDNDGTLWAEKPLPFQFFFALDRVRALAPQHPEWNHTEPFRSVLKGDMKGLEASGEKGAVALLGASHAGISTEAFNAIVRDWIKTARHPVYKGPYTDYVYQPMLEVLSYLRSKGFKTFIVSGGGVEFMRAFAETTYGIPPEQVVGSSAEVKFQIVDGKPLLIKQNKLEFINDGPGKPVGINRFIGHQPVMAFGNSDGDWQMLQYTMAGKGPRFALLVRHTDGEREFAYDRKDKLAKLDKALDEATQKGWTVVDMKSDWKTVFPAAAKP